jgi:hypothetical protein
MDHRLTALARRKPFVRRAMDRITARCGDVAFVVVDPDMARDADFEYELDMVLAAFNTPLKEPIAIIYAQRGTIEWVPDIAPPGA